MSVHANLPFAHGNHSLGRPRVLCWLESLCQALPGGLATSCVRDTGTSYSLCTGWSTAAWVHRSTFPGNTSMPVAAPSDTVTTQLTENSAPEALLLGCTLQAKASSQRACQGNTLFPATQETQNARF